MHQLAKSKSSRTTQTVAFACVALAHCVSGCASDSSTIAPVASGGSVSSGGATPGASGGSAQSTAGGATSTPNGGASSTAVGGSSTTASGGATPASGGATPASGGAATVSTGGTSSATGGAVNNVAGGAPANGGSAGAAGAADPCAPKTCASTANCTATKAKQELITDFANNASDFHGSAVEWWTELFGGTFVYPALDACAATQPTNPLSQTFANGNWHISGTVGTYSGFGIWLAPCMADFSSYKGLSFTISGNAGASGAVVMSVATAATTKPGTGTCSPNTATCVETTSSPCTAATKSIPVTSTATTVTVLWSDLTGGSPEVSPGPSAITGVSWTLDWAWTNTSANNYAVDLVIDDLKLVP